MHHCPEAAAEVCIRFRLPGCGDEEAKFRRHHSVPGLYFAKHPSYREHLCFDPSKPLTVSVKDDGRWDRILLWPAFEVTEVGPTVLPGFAGWSQKAMMGQKRCVWPESARRVFEAIYIALLRSAVPDDLIHTWILPCLGSRDFEQ